MTHGTTSTPYRVIAGLDFSALGDRAVVEGVRACLGREQSELHVLAVGSDEDGLLRLPGENRHLLTQELADTRARDHVAKVLLGSEALLHASSLQQIAVYVAPGSAAERLVALAAAIDADLIVIGTNNRTGLARLLLGSVAEEVVRTAGCGVLVLRPRDFLDGEKLPEFTAPLKPGEHALKPFAHAPTFHYVQRPQSSSIMPVM